MALYIALVFGLITSLRIALGVENPVFVVSSGSMIPTLNVGDIIIIQKVTPAQLNVGDIVVFRNPWEPYGTPIVHRIVNIRIDENGNYKVITVGDAIHAKMDQFSPWDASLLIGRVIIRIPYLGNLYLFLSSIPSKNMLTIIVVTIIIMLMMLFLFIDEDKKNVCMETQRKSPIYIISLNILTVFLIFLSLYGMLKELQLNITKYGIENVFLEVGFMSYRISCLINYGIRYGALTFSYFQFLLLILVLFNVVEVLFPIIRNHLKS
ncbi:MAG: signal peptidase I [Candidatus Bathyarchaeia archaeon]